MAAPLNVLFICTGNSARSILAERILDRQGRGRFAGFSAGSRPKGSVHPLALRVLLESGLPVAGLRSKSWEEFSGAGSPRFDFVITVCDNAAGEACPAWPGRPAKAHWSIPDPAAAQGSDEERLRAFRSAFVELETRIKGLIARQATTASR